MQHYIERITYNGTLHKQTMKLVAVTPLPLPLPLPFPRWLFVFNIDIVWIVLGISLSIDDTLLNSREPPLFTIGAESGGFHGDLLKNQNHYVYVSTESREQYTGGCYKSTPSS